MRRDFARGATLEQVYLRISDFCGSLKCGHTYANFFNQEDAVKRRIHERPNRVPFCFVWIGGEIVVTRDLSKGNRFPRGTRVKAIDGVPTRTILARLIPFSRADGGNDAKRVANLEVTGCAAYEAFDVFYPLLFPPTAASRTFKIEAPGRSPSTVVAELVPGSRKKPTQEAADPSRPLWTLTFPRPDTALLSMPDWAIYQSKWSWQAWLDTTLDDLVQRSVPNLIVDLRGNEGGNAVGDLILRRLVRAPARGPEYERRTRYQAVPPSLRPHLTTWDSSFYDWKGAVTPLDRGFFRLRRLGDEIAAVIQPSGRPYTGRVFVIVGPENSSATFEFALKVKQLRLGTLVGRPTGGSRRGINGGGFFFLTLPNSRIEIDIPLIGQFPRTPQPDAGVVPDLLVTPSASDIATGRDVELTAILKQTNKR